MSLLNIGVTGLLAHQSALNTTGNNITNANTPGYSRQRVELGTLPEQKLGPGYIGSGTQLNDIKRVVDQFLITQLRSDTSNYKQLEAMAGYFEQLDSLLADESTGIAPAIQSFFASLEQASQDPTSEPVRQVVISSAEALAQRFNALYSALQSQERSINRQLDSLTEEVNSLAQSIATLNQSIAEQTSPGDPNGQPNALLDKRDEMLRQLSELVGVKVVNDAGGMVNVFIGNGQPLVVGNQANQISTVASTDDPSRNDLVFVTSSGSSQPIGQFLSGGTIGGLLAYRKQSLDEAYNRLGQVALTVVDAFNQQQRLGLDLDGNFGNNLFTDINALSAQSNRVQAATTNTGAPPLDLGVFINDTSLLNSSDYQLSFGPGAGDYTLTRLSDGTATTGTLGGALPQAITTPDGFEIRLNSGTVQPGDRYRISPTKTGAQDVGVALQDPRELAFAQPVSTGSSLNNQGGGSISQGETLAVYESDGVTLQSTFATPGTLIPPLLIRFTSATTFDVLDNTNPAAPVAIAGMTGMSFTPGQNNTVTISDPVSGDPVYRFELSGNPATGDEFTVGYNANGSSDNRNALAMGGLRLQDAVGGKQDFESAYGLLVEKVGARTAEVQISRDAADTVLTQTQANRDSVSGVSLDEEAANLIRFEQAYNASAQVISVARTIFDSLLAAFR